MAALQPEPLGRGLASLLLPATWGLIGSGVDLGRKRHETVNELNGGQFGGSV